MKLTFVLIMGTVMMLTGCASNQRFDCPYTDGVRCKSVSEVDKLVSSGRIGKKDCCSKAKIEDTLSSLSPPPVSTLRTQEEVIQIWVAAFEGEDGINHQQTVLNTVLKSPQWLGVAQK